MRPYFSDFVYRVPRPFVVGGMLIIVIVLGMSVLVSADSATPAGAISQSYLTSSTNIGQGVIVSLASASSDQVVPATTSNVSELVGVAAEKPLLQLSNTSKSSVQIVTGGTTNVLVSDANGPVAVGDKITVSPISGIGMKAAGSAYIVGTAQKALATTKTVKEQIETKTGQFTTVDVGQLPVAINVVYYAVGSSSGSLSSFVPSYFQNLANSLAGKSVSPLRVLLAMFALVVGFLTVALMLNTGIRSSLISLGRNPLAKSALRRGLIDTVVAAMGVVAVISVLVVAILAV